MRRHGTSTLKRFPNCQHFSVYSLQFRKFQYRVYKCMTTNDDILQAPESHHKLHISIRFGTSPILSMYIQNANRQFYVHSKKSRKIACQTPARQERILNSSFTSAQMARMLGGSTLWKVTAPSRSSQIPRSRGTSRKKPGSFSGLRPARLAHSPVK